MKPTFDLGKFAKSLGWSLAGVSGLELPAEVIDRYRKWLLEYKGLQMTYLERRMNERLNPKAYFPKAQSILCFGLYYFRGWAKGELKVSNYSWDRDYHELLKEKLENTVIELQKELGKFQYKICVDTAPVLEKYWAQRAGLGWQGKNTLLLNPKFGSLFFLAEVLCSLPVSQFQSQLPMKDHCGTCTRCLEACPTSALEPYVLKAHQCISYWTLEHKGEFPPDTPSFKSWIAGCDICQEVCPWNQRLIPLPSDEDTLRFQNITRDMVESIEWKELIQDRAISYVRKEAWPRNLKQALRSDEFLESL